MWHSDHEINLPASVDLKVSVQACVTHKFSLVYQFVFYPSLDGLKVDIIVCFITLLLVEGLMQPYITSAWYRKMYS
jgi:hypothetical protein